MNPTDRPRDFGRSANKCPPHVRTGSLADLNIGGTCAASRGWLSSAGSGSGGACITWTLEPVGIRINGSRVASKCGPEGAVIRRSAGTDSGRGVEARDLDFSTTDWNNDFTSSGLRSRRASRALCRSFSIPRALPPQGSRVDLLFRSYPQRYPTHELHRTTVARRLIDPLGR